MNGLADVWDFSQLGSVPSGLGTVFAACVAWKISRSWRQQLVAKRRQEVAEEALLAAYKARPVLRAVRSPWFGSAEQLDDDGKPGGVFFGVRRRLARAAPEQDAIARVILLADVHFGKDAAEPLRGIQHLFSRVATANFSLYAGKRVAIAPDLLTSLAADRLHPEGEEPDRIGKEMNRLIAELEAHLRPHLRLPNERDAKAPRKDLAGRLVDAFWPPR